MIDVMTMCGMPHAHGGLFARKQQGRALDITVANLAIAGCDMIYANKRRKNITQPLLRDQFAREACIYVQDDDMYVLMLVVCDVFFYQYLFYR